KALGGGVPVAAALFSERVAAAAAFGDHGTTYGGNPLACRAAIVFLDELENGLLAHVNSAGEQFAAGLRRLAARHAHVREIRGRGLMWGIDLDRPALPVVEAALKAGLLVNRTAETVVRLLPPYVITSDEIDEGLAVL